MREFRKKQKKMKKIFKKKYDMYWRNKLWKRNKKKDY